MSQQLRTSHVDQEGDTGQPRGRQEQLLNRISDLEREIESLKSYQDPYSLIPPTSSPVTRGLIEELRTLIAQFHSQKLAPRIQQLQEQIRKLETLFDACTSIHHLPVEIISTIFLLVTLDPLPRAPRFEGHLPLASILLTQVCRRWRTVALDCTTLWSVIDLSHPWVAEVFLGRGRSGLITVLYDGYIHDARVKHQACLVLNRILSKDLHRIRQLISCGTLPLEGTIHSVPALEALTMNEDSNPRLGALIQGPFPKIRRLEVGSCYLPWSRLPLSSTLTHLDVRGLRGAEDGFPLNATYLNSLRNLRNLRQLEIHDALPNHLHAGSMTDLSPVSLPSLRHVGLTSWTTRISSFLRLVRIPKEANVYIFSIAGPDAADTMTSIAQLVDNYHTSTEAESGVQRRLDTLSLTEGTSQFDYQPEPGNASTPPIFRLDLIDHDRWVTDVELPDIISAHPRLNSLTSLMVNELSGGLDQSVWRRFGLLPNLKIITLQQTSPFDLFDVLDKKSTSSTPITSGPYFPALSTLELIDMDEDELELDIDECVRRIIRICKRRIGFRHPISEIHIEECECFEFEDIARIRQSVPSLNVVWDGYSYESSVQYFRSEDVHRDGWSLLHYFPSHQSH